MMTPDQENNVVDLAKAREVNDHLEALLRQLREQGQNSGGSGGGGDGLEARVARVEAAVESVIATLSDIRSDVRELRTDQQSNFKFVLGAGAVATIGVLGTMAAGFGWV
jgi:hypothetical protein